MESESVHDRRWWALAVLCFSLLIIALDNTILNVALPALSAAARTPPPASCSGSSTATRSSSPACCSPPAASATASAARALLAIGLVIFGVGSLSARSATSSTQLALSPGPSWASAPRSSCRPRCRCSPTSSPTRVSGAGPSASGPASPAAGGAIGPVHRRVPAPALLVGLGLPRQRAGRASWPWSAGCFLLPQSRDPDAPRLDPIGALLSIVGLVAAAVGHHRGARPKGWTDPSVVVGFVAGVARARRLRRLGAAHRPPDARRALLQEPPLHGRQHRHHDDLLRPVRLDVPHHPVPADGARLLRPRGRAAHAADGRA